LAIFPGGNIKSNLSWIPLNSRRFSGVPKQSKLYPASLIKEKAKKRATEKNEASFLHGDSFLFFVAIKSPATHHPYGRNQSAFKKNEHGH
jgi:hypothetical protein